ncbi:MAG: tyrosine--tRNA ligase [Planctomycetes bacterium]|nr:tyrosine--tRNA ligase [Planctomycetota bacterium]
MTPSGQAGAVPAGPGRPRALENRSEDAVDFRDIPVDEQLARLRRGVVDLVHENELRARLERAQRTGQSLRIKLGMDPTGHDLHLGHTVVLRKLRTFQDLGHQAVLIIGDATARVGDPSGRDRTRPVLTAEAVTAFAAGWMAQVRKVLDVAALEVRHNSEFFAPMRFQDFLELCGRMTVAQMLERNDFGARYRRGDPIGIHEFLYPLMQGWDSVCVRADVELGGTDQLFNLHVGRDFQQAEGQEPQVLLTTPIVEGTDGTRKMSKTYDNAIGIDEPPGEIFGKLMSIPDALMEKYFVHFTDLPEEDIRALLAGHPRHAKARLGREVAAWLHSPAAAAEAEHRFDEVFAHGHLPDDMPAVVLSRTGLADGRIWIVELLRRAGLVASGGEARRLVRQGAVSLDGERLADPDAEVAVRTGAVLRVGKRRFARVQLGE